MSDAISDTTALCPAVLVCDCRLFTVADAPAWNVTCPVPTWMQTQLNPAPSDAGTVTVMLPGLSSVTTFPLSLASIV